MRLIDATDLNQSRCGQKAVGGGVEWDPPGNLAFSKIRFCGHTGPENCSCLAVPNQAQRRGKDGGISCQGERSECRAHNGLVSGRKVIIVVVEVELKMWAGGGGGREYKGKGKER